MSWFTRYSIPVDTRHVGGRVTDVAMNDEKDIFYAKLKKIGECITAEEWDADKLFEGSEAYVETQKLADIEKWDRLDIEYEMWECVDDFRDYDDDGKVIPGSHGVQY